MWPLVPSSAQNLWQKIFLEFYPWHQIENRKLSKLFHIWCSRDFDTEIILYPGNSFRNHWCIMYPPQNVVDSIWHFCLSYFIAEVTNCQRKQMDATCFNGVPSSGDFIPRCRTDGSFESVQCDGATPYCWCVDNDNGYEMQGTREWGTPNCTAPRK